MPFSINGTFTIINTFVANTPILSADVNEDFDDIADGLTALWARTEAFSVSKQVFTADDTYIPTDGLLSCIIECYGAGASGGGAASTAGTFGGAGGGGGGGYSRFYAQPGDIGASKTVTIGVGGAATAATQVIGNDGTDTSVGALCVAKGGAGGGGGGGGTAGGAGTGAIAGTGDIAAPGPNGSVGAGASILTVAAVSGGGANTAVGSGGSPRVATSSGGLVGTGYGSGGSGGLSVNNAAPAAGGAGANGLVIITEFIGPT